MSVLKNANLGLAFALEVAMLAAFAWWGLDRPVGAPWPWVIAAAAVGAGIGIWAVWGAPKSRHRLGMPALLWFKAAMFGLAILGLATAGQPGAAAWFAALAIVHLGLAAAWRQV